MGLPRKKKYDIDVYPGKIGNERINQLMAESDEKSTFLPTSITLHDIDSEMFKTVNEGSLAITARGASVPCIFMTKERWSIFSKTWMISDLDKNQTAPFITMRRTDVRKGTYRGDNSSTPNRKVFHYMKVQTFEDGVLGYDIYKIPQPTPVDIEYEIQLFSRDLREVNTFLKHYLSSFTDMQLYINVKGHYFSVKKEDGNSMNDNTISDVNGDSYYLATASIFVQGYLQDEAEFTKEKGVNRIMQTIEYADEAEDLSFETTRRGIKPKGQQGYGHITVFDKYNPNTPLKVLTGQSYTGYTAPDVTVLDPYNPQGPVMVEPGGVYEVKPEGVTLVSLEFNFPPGTIDGIMLVISHSQVGTYDQIETSNVDSIAFYINGEQVAYPFSVVGGDTLEIQINRTDLNIMSRVDLEGHRNA